MPIVKQKINLNILQIAAEKDLRRRSCPFVTEIHSVDNSRNISHLSVEDINEQTHPSQEALLVHKIDYEHLDGNVGKQIKLRSKISQKKEGTETLRSKLMYREQIRSNNSKILLIASSLHIKTPNNRLSETEKNVKQLVTLMLNSQTKLSKERKKLFGAIQHLHTYMNKNEQLDQQMKDATLEQYVELKAEVNRNGEKCEETKKVMAASRKQFENDVASATQLREKLCDFQNRLQISELNVHDLKENNSTKKQTLRKLLHLKNEQRLKKDNLHRTGMQL